MVYLFKVNGVYFITTNMQLYKIRISITQFYVASQTNHLLNYKSLDMLNKELCIYIPRGIIIPGSYAGF